MTTRHPLATLSDVELARHLDTLAEHLQDYAAASALPFTVGPWLAEDVLRLAAARLRPVPDGSDKAKTSIGPTGRDAE